MTGRRSARNWLTAAAALVGCADCARPPAGPPPDPAAAFLGEIYVFASNQSSGRNQMMMRLDRPRKDLEVSMLYGPAGQARSTLADGDSLVIVWAGREGRPDYRFVLRPTRGDSVGGTWEGPEGRGTLRGRHAPS
ncbi:hypothetical protein tb265_22290 [Gemmatimonadetes bacterium T265]|nr:hypothetical protein tb265_22290 [Gemmatimonadetes bacterium T265]